MTFLILQKYMNIYSYIRYNSAVMHYLHRYVNTFPDKDPLTLTTLKENRTKPIDHMIQHFLILHYISYMLYL